MGVAAGLAISRVGRDLLPSRFRVDLGRSATDHQRRFRAIFDGPWPETVDNSRAATAPSQVRVQGKEHSTMVGRSRQGLLTAQRMAAARCDVLLDGPAGRSMSG